MIIENHKDLNQAYGLGQYGDTDTLWDAILFLQQKIQDLERKKNIMDAPEKSVSQ